MPELPEVESIRLALDGRLTGEVVRWARINLQRIVRRGRIELLVGRRMLSTGRRGKFIWFDFEGEVRLFAHMGMSGTLLWLGDDIEEPSHVRAVLGFTTGRLAYRDPRTLGGLWIVSDGVSPWRKMGIDLLDPRFTTAEFARLLAGRRSSIKTTLMNQTLIAGLGNIYTSETLFRAGIHPGRPARELKPDEVRRLHRSIIDTLKSAIKNRGTTFRDYRLSDGRSGGFQDFLKAVSYTHLTLPTN